MLPILGNMLLPRHWLKQLRTEAKLTHRQLAKVLGVTHVAAISWESGARRPSYPNMLALAKLLGPEVMDRFAAESSPQDATQDGRVA